MVMKELLIGITANAIVTIVWYLLRRRGNKPQPINPDVKHNGGGTSKILPGDPKNVKGKIPKEPEKIDIPLKEIFPLGTVSPINQNDDSQNEEFWYKKLDELDREFRKKEEV